MEVRRGGGAPHAPGHAADKGGRQGGGEAGSEAGDAGAQDQERQGEGDQELGLQREAPPRRACEGWGGGGGGRGHRACVRRNCGVAGRLAASTRGGPFRLHLRISPPPPPPLVAGPAPLFVPHRSPRGR